MRDGATKSSILAQLGATERELQDAKARIGRLREGLGLLLDLAADYEYTGKPIDTQWRKEIAPILDRLRLCHDLENAVQLGKYVQ